MLVRLSLGAIVTRVAARARSNAYSPARARICATRGTSDSATPPVITTTSGFRPFTTVQSIAPRARHASSTTDDATGSPSLAARKTSGAVIARGSPPAAASSGASESAATRTTRPSSTIPAPKLVPGASTTSEPAPRPAPNIHSPSASALTSLSTNAGRPNRSLSSAASARPASSGTWGAGSPTRPETGSTAPGTPTPMAASARPRPSASARTAAISPTIVGSARPLPSRWVDTRCSMSTSPSRVTTPAAVVVAPTSTPSRTASPFMRRLEIAEVAEGDAQRHGGGACRRCAEADQLGLALARIPALRERVVEHAGVSHELRDAGREIAQPYQGRREGPVGAGARFAEEMVGRPEAGRAGAGTRKLVLAPHRNAEPLRRGEHDAGHRLVEAHVVMRVEVRRGAFRERHERLDLRLHLAFDVLHLGALRRAARVADEASRRVHQGPRARERTAERQVDVEADSESRVARRDERVAIHVEGDEHRRARDDAVTASGEDAGRHAAREPEVVGVHDQASRHGVLGGARALDHDALDRRRHSRRHRRLGVEGADVIEALVADPRERLRLARDDGGREPGRLELGERGLSAKEGEDREDESAAGLEVGRRALDHAVEDLPAVHAAVVCRGLGIRPRVPAWCGHLRRVRADQVEPLARDGRVAVAEPRVHAHAVQEGVPADQVDGAGDDVGGHHHGAGLGHEDRREPEPAAELEHALAGTDGEMLAEEERPRLGRLDPARDAEQRATPGEEEQPLVVTCQGPCGSRGGGLP